AIAGLIAMTGIVRRYLIPLSRLIQAQLNPNGGGSLVDKVNRILPNQEEARANHQEAQRHWEALEFGQTALSKEISALKVKLEEFGSTQIDILERQNYGGALLEAAFVAAPEEQRR